MEIYSALFFKIVPLYMNILLGFLAGKLLDTSRDTIARMMFYMINPIVIFNGVLNTHLDTSVLSVPILTFFLGSGICLLFYRLSKNMWNDSSRNILAFSSGCGNSGYFGLPLALLLFNDQGEGVYIMAMLGITLYENSIGYYICAKGTHTPAECFQKLLKLPAIYAFILGLAINCMHIAVPGVFADFMSHIKGTYTVLGMMIIGLGLATLHNFRIDMKYISMAFFAKFIVWPSAVLLFCFLDRTYFHIYDSGTHNALILISIVPLAVNSVIVASLLKAQPEKAATAVLFSTLFALIYVPLMASYFI
jgi:hypothetical protein